MDEKYLLERMDNGFKEVREHISNHHKELSQKIEELQRWKYLLVGGASVIGGILSFVANVVIHGNK